MKTKLLFGILIMSAGMAFGQVTPGGGGGVGDPTDPGNGGEPPVIEDPDPCCLGNYCSLPTKPLYWHRQLELDRYNFNFTGDMDYTTKVNLGYTCRGVAPGKLNVYTNKLTSFDPFSGTPRTIGFASLAENNTPGTVITGADVAARTNANYGIPIGLHATANGPGSAYGVLSELVGGTSALGIQTAGEFRVVRDSSYRNVGVVGMAFGKGNMPNLPFTPGPKFNIGVAGWSGDNQLGVIAHGFQSIYPISNVSIFGGAGNMNVGLYSTPSNFYAGWFDGDVMLNGVGYLSSFGVFTSDRRFKKDIKSIENASDLIAQLNPSTYFMETNNEYGMHFSAKKQYGFISQEVEKIIPDLVTDVHKPASVDKDGKEITKAVDYKGLDYMAFIALLTKGLQEQQKKLEELAATNQEMKQQLQQTGIQQLNSVETGFQMSQNVPNPFTHETVVNYTIPASVSNAHMAVYDLTGKQITTFPISQKGSASLTITSEKLAAGIYIYSIVADGKIMDSKRMIVAEK